MAMELERDEQDGPVQIPNPTMIQREAITDSQMATWMVPALAKARRTAVIGKTSRAKRKAAEAVVAAAAVAVPVPAAAVNRVR